MPTNEENPTNPTSAGVDVQELQKELAAYHAAIEEEYKMAAESQPDNVEEHTRNFFRGQAPMAAAQIAWIAANGANESSRLNASKFIIDMAIEEGTKEGDPIKQLLNELSKNDKRPAPAPKAPIILGPATTED